MANVKKAFIGENKDLVDPYVQIQFAGQKVSNRRSQTFIGPSFCNVDNYIFRQQGKNMN